MKTSFTPRKDIAVETIDGAPRRYSMAGLGAS